MGDQRMTVTVSCSGEGVQRNAGNIISVLAEVAGCLRQQSIFRHSCLTYVNIDKVFISFKVKTFKVTVRFSLVLKQRQQVKEKFV